MVRTRSAPRGPFKAQSVHPQTSKLNLGGQNGGSKDGQSHQEARAATLDLKLTADSGYVSTESHRVTPDQWERIVKIVNEEMR